MDMFKNLSSGLRGGLGGGLSQLEAYLGVKAQSFLLFAGLIVLTAALVTVGYWGYFGFGHWKNEMKVANALLTAAATSPMVGQGVAVGQSGQYFCPQHGAVGLPRANAAGQAVCPLCGQFMQLRCFGTVAATATPMPAAFQPGGGGGG